MLLEVGVGRMIGAGADLGSDIGTDGTTGVGCSDGAFPLFDVRVRGFVVPSVFAVPKNEC